MMRLGRKIFLLVQKNLPKGMNARLKALKVFYSLVLEGFLLLWRAFRIVIGMVGENTAPNVLTPSGAGTNHPLPTSPHYGR
jgi:hypothetical protein